MGRQGAWRPVSPRLTLTATLVAAALVAAAVGTVSGCATEALGDGAAEAPTCSTCHGNSVSPAPPKALDGSTSRTSLGVGAHRAHLTDSPLRAAIACDECHVVPETVDAPGHVDALPAELTFGTLATSRGAEPAWDRDAATCSNVYCHGATLSGGANTVPKWTVADGSQAQCGACHGTPPPAPHPQTGDSLGQCSYCHPGTVAPDGTILVAEGKHINGVVDARGWTCTDCHGSDLNPAPPKSVEGLTATTEVGVGAHQAHLADGPLRAAVACGECHVVPERADAPGHLGPLPAEVTFGALAKTGGLEPTWDRGSNTCSNVYCHGETVPGGTNTTPDWTVVDGTQAACGTCHGFPPPAPHTDRTDCYVCHGETVNQDGTIAWANGTHINGTVDVVASCNACHGSEDNPAPPKSVEGLTATTETVVGAHQAHLHDSAVAKAVACGECHVVPTALGDAGHIDPAPAEVTFGSLATTDGAAPTWDRTSNTCSNVYCHGDTLAGGQHTTPDWTLVDGSQAGCASCHGFPPPAPHPDNMACGTCHPSTVNADGTIDVQGGAHINGQLDF